jgi:hypothetical protein
MLNAFFHCSSVHPRGTTRMINNYKHFLEDLDAKKILYSERIQKFDPILGPARLLRFVQLHTRAWFLRVQEANDHAEARTIKSPPYHKPGEKMVVNSMSWLPDMPHTGPKQNSLTPGHPGDRGNEKKRGNPGGSSSIWNQTNLMTTENDQNSQWSTHKRTNIRRLHKSRTPDLTQPLQRSVPPSRTA